MKYLILLILLGIVLFSCTQVNDAPQSGVLYEKFTYNERENGTIYDSAWVLYNDTIVIINVDTVLLDTFNLKSRTENKFIYGSD